MQEITGGWEKKTNEELKDLYLLLGTIRVVGRRARHVACIVKNHMWREGGGGEVRKLEGKICFVDLGIDRKIIFR
jgi:hypothetical protein